VPCTYGFLSTYPPTQCGLATFTAALMRSLVTPESGDRAGVVRVVDTPVRSQAPEVVGHLHTQAPAAHLAAAQALNAFDVAVVQHEFGIYGGPDGDQLLAVLDEVRVPVITVAHTVPSSPTLRQREVLEQVVEASAAVVTMTKAARSRLVAGYRVDPEKVVIIPHGAVRRSDGGGGVPTPGSRPLILTWGLLGPGKGIEWAIDGLQMLQRLHPRPAYIVAGQTHPRVRQQQGEAYRLHLGQRARAVGVSDLVRFASSYLDEAALTRLIRRADVILLPYDSRDQVTSGVLVEAIAAGKPVVATAFPHAVEMLSDGAGMLVPQYDANAIGAALYRILTEPDHAVRMVAAAEELVPPLLWPTVAEQYRTLVQQTLLNPVKAGLADALVSAEATGLPIQPGQTHAR
jgi:glycosyltransferase involved in cell wall biosynthesis